MTDEITRLSERIVTLESDNAALTKERNQAVNIIEQTLTGISFKELRKAYAAYRAGEKYETVVDRIEADLAAAQATIAKLRDAVEGAYDYVEEAIQSYVQCYGDKFRPERLQYIRSVKASCDEALALPLDTTALQERLAAERERCAKVCEQLAGDSIGKTFASAIRSM